MDIKLRVTFPVLKSWSSEIYALMILDSAGVTHYWDFDGTYDGYSSESIVDCHTGAHLN